MNDALLQNARRAHELGSLDHAARLYAEILRADSAHFEALYSLGVVQYERGRFADAHRILTEAVKLAPDSPNALFAHGCALQRLNRHAQALKLFDRTLTLNAEFADANLRRANTLLALGRYRDAIAAYDLHLAADRNCAEAWHNRGIALSKSGRFTEAASTFSEALALRPDSAASWQNRGNVFLELENFEQAIRDQERALDLDSDLPDARGNLVIAKLSCCEWTGLKDEQWKIASALRAGSPAIVPFGNVMISDSSSDQMKCARLWIERHTSPQAPLWRGERYKHGRIRLAYLSGDFREHPVGILMAGVFEHHDRKQFECFGISFGSDDKSETRARIAAGLEHFIDARPQSDFGIATLIREMEIDIAVDLMGITAECRSGILAFRPAPVHVAYLGYPGTMAASFMDYILADRIVIPEDQKLYYSEKVAYLPDSYLATDARRQVAGSAPSRSEAGLPEKGFVFGSLHGNYKIMPDVFSVWMRILRAVGGSVLWVPETNAIARRNLERAATEHGIASSRLVFAPRLASAGDYLARLQLADLFLDTLPFNAHSTAIDALWAGVPVLSCMGSTLASRVGASLLHAIGLPELIAKTLEDYETTAIALARDTNALSTIRNTLARNRTRAALFDTNRLTRNLEAAFAQMRERAEQGRAPQGFAVDQP
jgi:protein O-GlcNAc transferase